MASSEPLWKCCADWLYRLKVLPDNHRILWPDASMKDLAYTLRDGVLLCHVASAISPESIEQKNVNQRPQMAQFLCLKNIKIFLSACRDCFCLKETDLFQPSMLYDYTDFARVLQTLSKLSYCEVAQTKKPNIEGFPQRTLPLSSLSIVRTTATSKNAQHEEEIYRYFMKGPPVFKDTKEAFDKLYIILKALDCALRGLDKSLHSCFILFLIGLWLMMLMRINTRTFITSIMAAPFHMVTFKAATSKAVNSITWP